MRNNNRCQRFRYSYYFNDTYHVQYIFHTLFEINQIPILSWIIVHNYFNVFDL